MVDQTQVDRDASQEGNGHAGNGYSAGRAARRNLAGLAHDVTTMAELQVRLTLLDAQQASRRAIYWLAVAIVGGLIVLSCFPVAMIGIAALLVQTTGLSPAAAHLLTGGVFAVLGVLALFIAGRQILRSLAVFRRSQNEFISNLEWFKGVLKSHHRSSG
jgi:hypothetical protein